MCEKKEGQATHIASLRPPYPCFRQDLGDWEGADRIRLTPPQIYKLFLFASMSFKIFIIKFLLSVFCSFIFVKYEAERQRFRKRI